MCLGIPGRIIAITDADKLMARVDVAGVQREINIACVVDPGQVPDSCIGTWVLVHVGFAMSRIDEQEAQKTLQLLAELGDMQEELTAMQSTARP